VGLVLAGAVIVTGASATADRGKPSAPSLRLIRIHPVTVAGAHFRPRNRVRVSLVAARTVSRNVTATGRGAFTVTFSSVVIDRCSSFSVLASQRHGATVVLHGPKPECPPA
jgi:hypothetical protein